MASAQLTRLPECWWCHHCSTEGASTRAQVLAGVCRRSLTRMSPWRGVSWWKNHHIFSFGWVTLNAFSLWVLVDSATRKSRRPKQQRSLCMSWYLNRYIVFSAMKLKFFERNLFKSQFFSLKNDVIKRQRLGARGIAQLHMCLLGKHEVVSSIPSNKNPPKQTENQKAITTKNQK